MRGTNKSWFAKGMRDAIPIALGYLAVSFTLGIAAKNAGFTPFQAFLVSFTNNASAGEFAGFTLIAAGGGYLEVDSDIDHKCPLSSDVLCIKPETSTRHTNDPASASKL